jgi:hypothetical protein
MNVSVCDSGNRNVSNIKSRKYRRLGFWGIRNKKCKLWFGSGITSVIPAILEVENGGSGFVASPDHLNK